MARFKKNGKKELPEINNSSMSDIIFMCLFFFMVITTMRESDAQVQFTPPSATEYQKMEKKSTANIYMGIPKVQGADKFARTQPKDLKDDIEVFVLAEKEKDPEKANTITYCLKIDSEVRMTSVNALKMALRQNNALKISYATNKDKKVKK